MKNLSKIFILGLLDLFILTFSLNSFASLSEDFLIDLGKKYFKEGRFSEAALEFKKVLILNPRNKQAKEYREEIRHQIISHTLDRFVNLRKQYPSQELGVLSQEKFSPQKKLPPLSKFEKEEKSKKSQESFFKKGSLWSLRGKYQASVGFNSSDFTWKDANADKAGVPGEKSWRYLWGKDRYNTFDRKIYSGIKFNLDSNFPSSPWSIHSQIVIDPWTFVGIGEVDAPRSRSIDNQGNITLHPSPTDWAHIKLKYWSGSNTTIDEIYRSEQGNIVRVPEIKVSDGKTPLTWGTGAGEDWTWDGKDDHWGQFEISPSDIDYMYRPLRELFITYKGDNFTFTLFPIAYQDKAYTSDDPLRLSNNHIWWEESPWLEEFEPSRQYTRPNNPIERARWMRRYAFVARDSELTRLTFLRGFSLELYPTANTTLNFTAASPMSLWDRYRTGNSIEEALRFKWVPFDELTLGIISTSKFGLNGGSLEGENYLWGLNYSYKLKEDVNLFGEIASTYTKFEEADGYRYSYPGYAFMQGIRFNNGKLYWAYLDKQFYPGLSNYRYTREDPYYGRHIHFFDLNPENEATRIGDSIDTGRQVIGLRYKKDSKDKNNSFLFDFRNVHKDSGKYIETIFRTETTSKLNNQLTLKTLVWYKHLPKTHAGLDPLVNTKNVYYLTDYFSDRDEPVRNPDVVSGKNPSIGHFSIGAKYDFSNWFSFIPIYERTNDPELFPRALLSTCWYEDELIDGRWYDKMVPTLYEQGFFELPPYDYYSIIKAKFIFVPSENWRIIFKGARNSNKYSSGIDDNINHLGLEITYKPQEKINIWFQYIYSKFIDLYRQLNNEGIHYDGHHNVFIGLRYNFDEDSTLDFMFGESPGYGYKYYDGEWSLSSVDTQHLFRLYYKKEF